MSIRTALVATALAAATVLGGAATAVADSEAEGSAYGSPGVLSGNVIQVPVHVPINVCGNSINVIALLNPASATCVNDGHGHHHHDNHHWNH
ncbi:chaplin [Streptomyces sp. NPDC000151]|uniref:chaplin n=1 Tax=Streptomyces sp. NPDC000151 TaxID=3154244 RepID=UPI00332C8E8D